MRLALALNLYGLWTVTDSYPSRILVTGATGYVGGRLLRRLAEQTSCHILAMARQPKNIALPSDKVEACYGDIFDPKSLDHILPGVKTAYYLVHSMGATDDFQRLDRLGAQYFADACVTHGVEHMIYLGGLGSGLDNLSPHLRSRHEVGDILRQSGVITTELRASIIIGSGSLSFELIRALVEKLPFMITPKWVRTKTQPISIEDVITYLIEAAQMQPLSNQLFEIGGPDVVSYQDLLMEYARQRGLKRYVLSVPVLTPKFSSLWLGLVTPLYARIGRKLIDGLYNETIVTDDSALAAFQVKPRSVKDAIARALINEDSDYAETRWVDALSSKGLLRRLDSTRVSTRIIDQQNMFVRANAEHAFYFIQRIGGNTGWYYANWLWKLRGALDLLVGGVGMRRGRNHPSNLRQGEPVDFWRVEQYEPGRLLRLFAEMRLPGRAWLQFEVQPDHGGCHIFQTAIFDPIGLWGRIYWYSLFPFHLFIFKRMLGRIAQLAQRRAFNQVESQPTSAQA